MFLTLWNYLRGYVIIEVTGFSVERFVNLAVNKDIYIWDVVPKGKGVSMKVSIKGFKLLKSCAKKTKCHLKIIGKQGYPFIAFRYRKRQLFLLGILTFVLILYSLSSFIWLIEIEGNERIQSEQLLAFCEQNGFKIGSLKYKIDTKKLEKEMINNFSDLSWITIKINGTRAIIKLTETIPKLEIVDTNTPCDIIAKKDGLITNIVTSTGTPKVKAKDVVEKGDTLVSGELVVKEDETGTIKKYVHAKAEIKAKQWHKINVSVPFKYTVKNYTDNIKNDYSIILFNKDINFLKPNITYQNCDKIISRKQLSASKDFVLPAIIVTTQYKEYISEEKQYSYEEAKTISEKLVTEKIIQDFDFETDIIDKSFEYKKTENSLDVTATISVIESIGIEKLISEENTNILTNEGSNTTNGTAENTNTE